MLPDALIPFWPALPVRARKTLYRLLPDPPGPTVAGILALTPDQLLAVPGCGNTTLAAIAALQDELRAPQPTATAAASLVVGPTAAPPAAPAAPDPERVVYQDGEDDLRVVARYPYQIQQSQQALTAWAKDRVAAQEEEAADAQENLATARAAGLRTDTLAKVARLAAQRVDYYRKILLALEAGYLLVPNFPVDLIGIRVNKARPTAGWKRWHRAAQDVSSQVTPLPAGEGEFVSTTAEVATQVDHSDAKQEQIWHYPAAWRHVDFPFLAVKPQVLSATAKALTAKLFDQIGVMSGRRPGTAARRDQRADAASGQGGDPIVVGRVLAPGRRDDGGFRYVTFLICWFIDTKAL